MQDGIGCSAILDIEYFLPSNVITNDDLEKMCGADKDFLLKKLGIRERRIAAEGEGPSDLAVEAINKIFKKGRITPEEVDLLIVCTQNPDYKLPTTACIVQDRTGIKKECAAFDINLGCSAFPYSLAVASGFIATGMAKTALVVMSEVYSKVINYKDRSVCTLFGDAAAVAVVKRIRSGTGFLAFDFGTDGAGYDKLIVPAGGAKLPVSQKTSVEVADASGNVRSLNNLKMVGKDIFAFANEVVPRSIANVLKKSSLSMADVDFFVFHQPNKYMFEYLLETLSIEKEKTITNIEYIGNTVSASIPIALKDALDLGKIRPGDVVLLCGFGVGLSWGTTLMQWASEEAFI